MRDRAVGVNGAQDQLKEQQLALADAGPIGRKQQCRVRTREHSGIVACDAPNSGTGSRATKQQAAIVRREWLARPRAHRERRDCHRVRPARLLSMAEVQTVPNALVLRDFISRLRD